MADHDVEGHLIQLLNVLSSEQWADLWVAASCEVESFDQLGISRDVSDSELWRICQEQGIVLITGNRNAESAESREQTIRQFGREDSLPVLTIGDTSRLIRDRGYRQDIAARLLDYLSDIDHLRGAGRLYLP
jgi:hypothetical protein